MNSPNQSNDPAPVDLTGHLRWMRALARGLVRDDAAADDLVQDAAVAALRDKAARPLDVRAWLGSILRNRARDAGRSRDARQAREAASARPESGEDTSELEQRAAIGAELSQRVLGLDEPLRSTLLMRYWDDLPPRVIAKRTGVPVATVKSRLARGLERLRRDLDASRGGDRKAWLVVVLPLAGKAPLVAAGSAVGWTVMNVKILAAATVVAATCAVLFLRDGRAETAAPLDEPTERAERFAGENGGFASSGSGGDGESAQRTGSRRGAGTEIPAATEAVTYTVEVKVVDGSGRPLSRVEVMLEDSDARAEADARGLAVLTASESTGSIVAADTEKWVTVRPGNWRSANPQTSLVVLAPRLDFQGRVVDAFGFGVEGAEVSFDLPRAFASRFDESFGASTRRDWNVRTDEDGAFLLEDAPGIEGASLIASREGYAAAAVEAPAQGASGVEITLRKPLDPDALPLRGRVVRRSGEAAPGARVSLGGELVAVDAEGLFELDLRLVGPAKVLRAIEAGALPARYEVQEDPSDARRGWPEFVELELGEAPLSIAGVVVDEKGDPLAGARVWLDDPTEFGALGVLPVRAEALAAGLAPPTYAVRSLAELAAPGSGASHGTAMPVGDSNACLQWTTTNESGRFRLEGLDDRAYTLNVLGPTIDYLGRSERIDAGDDTAEIVIDTSARHTTLKGRVVTRQGDAVSGVFVTPWIPAIADDVAVRDGTSSVNRFFVAKAGETDEEGNFTLSNVPTRFVQFHVAGQSIVPSYGSVDDVDDPTDFEIVVEARVEVSVEIVDTSLGIDRVAAIAEGGGRTGLLRLFADGYSTLATIDVVDGRTGVFALTTKATALQLMSGDTVVDTVELRLRPGEVARVVY